MMGRAGPKNGLRHLLGICGRHTLWLCFASPSCLRKPVIKDLCIYIIIYNMCLYVSCTTDCKLWKHKFSDIHTHNILIEAIRCGWKPAAPWLCIQFSSSSPAGDTGDTGGYHWLSTHPRIILVVGNGKSWNISKLQTTFPKIRLNFG